MVIKSKSRQYNSRFEFRENRYHYLLETVVLQPLHPNVQIVCYNVFRKRMAGHHPNVF